MDSREVAEKDFCGEVSFYLPGDLESMGIPDQAQILCRTRTQASWARREGRGLVLISWPDGIYVFLTLPPGGPVLLCGGNRLLLWDERNSPDKFPREIFPGNKPFPLLQLKYIRASLSLGEVFELNLDGLEITASVVVKHRGVAR